MDSTIKYPGDRFIGGKRERKRRRLYTANGHKIYTIPSTSELYLQYSTEEEWAFSSIEQRKGVFWPMKDRSLQIFLKGLSIETEMGRGRYKGINHKKKMNM